MFLAVGLPLTRFGSEKTDFVKYLTDKKEVAFDFESVRYNIKILNAAVFTQCYAAVADRIVSFKKKTLIVDIGSWTIDIMPVINKSPDESNCITIPKGLITCMRYVAIPCVAPIALGGFYSYNGMDFYEYMGKKLKSMFSNHPLVYMSTEGELAIREYQMELLGTGKKKKGKAGKKQEVPETRTDAQKAKNQEEFQAMKKKTKRLLFASIGVIVAAVAGIMAYKYMQ